MFTKHQGQRRIEKNLNSELEEGPKQLLSGGDSQTPYKLISRKSTTKYVPDVWSERGPDSEEKSLLCGCKKFQTRDAQCMMDQSREANTGQEKKGLEGQDKVFRV